MTTTCRVYLFRDLPPVFLVWYLVMYYLLFTYFDVLVFRADRATPPPLAAA